MYFVKTVSKNELKMSYMQTECTEGEVNVLGMQTLETYLTWTKCNPNMKCLI